jgi:hypothetical protein
LWYVSRNTPLAFFDALKSIAPFVVIGAAVCSTLFLVRLAVPFSSLYTGLAACVIIGLVLYVSALMTVPFGRETVASVLKLALPQYLLAAKTISRMRGGPSSP